MDLDNDGKAREVLPQFGNAKAPLAWYEAKNGAFVKHVVSPTSYGHGIGAGDVNGDGRNDIITPKGWFEAPPDPRTGDWKWHPDFDLGDTGFIYALDVNGDGRPTWSPPWPTTTASSGWSRAPAASGPST